MLFAHIIVAQMPDDCRSWEREWLAPSLVSVSGGHLHEAAGIHDWLTAHELQGGPQQDTCKDV